ncbi:unnamed protein product [Symbiodinium sp. CCMP2592]|nr:unnamed protein product [Symbiodinium sp. CCMP2592]
MSGSGWAGSSSWNDGTWWHWDDDEEEETGQGKSGSQRGGKGTTQMKGRQGGMALRARFEDGTQERTRSQADREAIRAPLKKEIKELKAQLATVQSEADHTARELGMNADLKHRAEMAEGRVRKVNLDLITAKSTEEVHLKSNDDLKKQLQDCQKKVTSLEAECQQKDTMADLKQLQEVKESRDLQNEEELRGAKALLDKKESELREVQEEKAKWKYRAHEIKSARKETARMVQEDMMIRMVKKEEMIQILQSKNDTAEDRIKELGVQSDETKALLLDLYDCYEALEAKLKARDGARLSPTSPARALKESGSEDSDTEVVSRQSDSEDSSVAKATAKRPRTRSR